MMIRKMNSFHLRVILVTQKVTAATVVHVVIPLDSLLLYHPLHLCFAANVGINVVFQSCEGTMAFVDLFCNPQFYEYVVDQP
jgi:hypothetical protein